MTKAKLCLQMHWPVTFSEKNGQLDPPIEASPSEKYLY